MHSLCGFARRYRPPSKMFSQFGLSLRAHLMLLRCLMLELFSKLLPRVMRLGAVAAPTPGVASLKPSESGWRRLQTGRSSLGKTVRHLFAIQRLPSGVARYPYNYCYYCVRCRWAFLVDGLGGVVPVDGDLHPLVETTAAYRRETFAHGPCGAHWASTAVIDGGRKRSDQESPVSNRRASLTLIRPRSSAVRAVRAVQ
jgi:hypothetical protein